MPLDTIVLNFVKLLQDQPTEFVSLLLAITCGMAIIILFKKFGKVGLFAFNALAVVLGNIQVLRVAEFSLSPEPIALGTVMFAATFMVTDIINELYGRKAARQSIFLSFSIYVCVTLCMIIDLGHTPITHDHNYKAMEILFSPSLRFFIASITAFLLSQLFDVWIFNWIKKLSQSQFLWLRTNGSTFISGLLDNFIFSLLAWIVLAPTPISFYTLMMTYVIGAYVYRSVINILLTPVIYYCRKIASHHKSEA